jgi:hypothetical protein
VRRWFIEVVTSLVMAGLAMPALAPAMVAAASPAGGGTVPKVVVIVGPAGAATRHYRAEARAAADAARAYTSDVTEIYSPNATWPAVRSALQGASLVIYMGHGNGWPSPYRDALYPPTQNGFGLNPSPNGDDNTHQYFGEAKIEAEVQLAPNAVVLLNHLCYASGNSEPGVAEGTLSMARKRVDNFAAGFIAAGAAAVVAEAWAAPDYMIRNVLGGRRSIDAAWHDAPSANGHAFAFASGRSPGYVAQMDPERRSSGFTRSIVLKAGLASSDVLRGATGRRSIGRDGEPPAAPITPSLAATGIALRTPRFLGQTSIGNKIQYRLTFAIADRARLPKAIQASIRWDPLEVVAPDLPADASTPAAAPAAAPPSTPASDASSAPSPDPAAAASPDPAASADPAPAAASGAPTPPRLDLVVPERLGDVVAPVKGKITKMIMAFPITLPTAAGRYRLTVTLHDADGVAYDAATQALLPSLLVRVTAALDAQVVAPAHVQLTTGATTDIGLWVANLGIGTWGHVATASRKYSAPATAARVVARWIALGADDLTAQAVQTAAATPVELPPGLAPGKLVPADLPVFAPWAPGDYLLILDIETPDDGSIVAAGVAPTVIRVKVVPEPVATPAPPLEVVPAGPGR